ncbi:MAG TPA: hypothetical protein VI168_17485 [Croceibacterium sp.]
MSKQLAVASAFSVFALTALALFAPGAAHEKPATESAAPVLAGDFASPFLLHD